MAIEPKIGVRVDSTVNEVTILRAGRLSTQRHRGYVARIWIPGEPEAVKCCHFHQKASAARRHGFVVARQIGKERGIAVMDERP